MFVRDKIKFILFPILPSLKVFKKGPILKKLVLILNLFSLKL
jgi:hypothetical protein